MDKIKKLLLSIIGFPSSFFIGLIGVLIVGYFSVVPLLFATISLSSFQWIQVIFSTTILLVPIFIFPKWYKKYLVVLTLLLFGFSFSQIFHIYMYDAIMPQSAYFVMMETNAGEGLEFLSTYADAKFFGLVFLFLTFPLIVLYKFPSFDNDQDFKIQSFAKDGRLTWFLFLILVTFYQSSYQKSFLYAYYENISIYKKQFAEFQNELAKRKNSVDVFKDLQNENPTDEEQIYVLIIGESTGKAHMGLYDYYRQTNPLLTKKKDELYIYQDVISPHSHTQPTLEKVLTFANHEDMDPLYKEGTLIELMNKADFKTYWLSNQHFTGEWNETVVSTIAKQSDWYLFVNDPNINDEISYDERLLKPLQKILKEKEEKKKFIVLHLLGTHGKYKNRYPHSKFNKYTDITTVKDKPFMSDWGRMITNEYDNAVVYNDSIVSQVIDLVKAKNKDSYVLYFSDHGEEVYDVKAMMSHQESNATITMFEIPFLLWTSEKYKKHNPQKTKNIEKSLVRKYQTDDVIHTLIDLNNFSLNIYDPTKSIISPSFLERERLMNGENYDKISKNVLVDTSQKKTTYNDLDVSNMIDKINKDEKWMLQIEEKAEKRKESIEDVIKGDAHYVLKQEYPNGYKKTTYNDLDVSNMIDKINKDEKWMLQIEEKAEKRKESIEDVITGDAHYVLKQEYPNGYKK